MKSTTLHLRQFKLSLFLIAAFAGVSSNTSIAQTINIGPNQYAFQFTQNPNFGLFFNSTALQYEFRNGNAASIFALDANNGNLKSNLSFANGSDYLVPNNRYAFRAASNPNYGLFFNSNSLSYEFRGSTGNSLLHINASTGALTTEGTIVTQGGSSDQWNQAVAWGNHASAGYISGGALNANEVPRWTGSTFAASSISSTADRTTISGNITSQIFSQGNLLTLNNTNSLGIQPSKIGFQIAGNTVGDISVNSNNLTLTSTTGGLVFRNGTTNRLVVTPDGSIGINNNNPQHTVDVGGNVYATTSSYAVRGVKTGNGTFPGVWGETESTSSNASGVRGFVNSTSPGAGSAGVYGHNYGTGGSGHGVKGIHDGNGYGVYGETKGGRGVYGLADAASSGVTAYGVYGRAQGGGGTRIGVYGTATGGSTNWAAYFVGNEYISGDLRVGTTNGANGYKLSVNGKAICTEMRVQLLSNWPDYVFGESHEMLNLDQLADFIKEEKHLPGIPSAAEVEAQGGIDLGEMQRLTVEKMEELTLYILELKKISDELRLENAALRQRIDGMDR